MSFPEYVHAHKDEVFNRLVSYLPKVGPKEYDEMVSCYSLRRGKYVRPALLLLWAQLCGGKLEDGILPAAALQASEDWLLMHDDIFDKNPLRRGLPAAHVSYGVDMAVNAGDAINAMSWKIAHDAAAALGSDRGDLYYDKFYDMIAITVRGQYIDLHLTREKDAACFTLVDYYESIDAKSGYYSVYGPMQLADELTTQALKLFDEAAADYPNRDLLGTARESLLYAAGRKK